MRNRIIILTIRGLFLLGDLFSQNQAYSNVDKYVAQISKNHYKDLRQLTKVLTKPYNNDILKTRAVFSWIKTNIAYDYETFNLIVQKNNTTSNTLRVHPSDALLVYADR